MRKFHLVLLALAALGLMSSLLMAAADISGVWKGDSDQGPPFSFTFKADSAALTGTMVNMDGKDIPISDGKIDGDAISFTIMTDYQGNPIKLVAKGKVAADAIQLRIDTDDGAWGTDVTLKKAPPAK